MIKVSLYLGSDPRGPAAIPLFTGKADGYFEKFAAPSLMPEVSRYIANLKPRSDAQYVLVNAMGAGEYWGSNINGDYFPEAALIHKPDDWTGNPLLDKIKAKDWAYGFPTFYNAKPFLHHRNKDYAPFNHPSFGEIELALWNPRMKRVELVERVDRDLCLKHGGSGLWDKLRNGDYPDTSMGCAPAGTRITLANGQQKAIEDVHEDDIVLSHMGHSRRVERTMRRTYVGTLYTLKVYGFRRSLSLTDEHPLWLVRGDALKCAPSGPQVNKGRTQKHCTPFVKASSKGCSGCATKPSYTFSWVRADQASVGDYLAFPVPSDVSRSIASKEEARLLGYYLAEGHVGAYNDRPMEQITFSLNLSEKDIAEDIERLARHLGAQVVWHDERPEKGGRYVHVVHKGLAARCLRFCGSGAKTKVVSRDILHLRRDLQLAFLGAYLDGDGGTYKGSAYFSTSSEQLAGQIFVMLARCGIISSVNEIDHNPSEKSVVRRDTVEYQVWVGTDFSSLLGPHTRKPVRASLKVHGVRFFYVHEGVTYIMSPILEIEEAVYDGEVYNFSVEKDDSYLVEMLATHNCKVPFDTCSICLDEEAYRKALSTYEPGKHKSPGEAALEYHRTSQKQVKTDKGIQWTGQGKVRGLSVTRADYCEHAKNLMNRILSDGRKVFVKNDFPKFFDNSFVFIGADRTAKTMMKIAEDENFTPVARAFYGVPSGSASYSPEMDMDGGGADQSTKPEGEEGFKTASAEDALKFAFLGKAARDKDAEIVKSVVPSQFAGKAIPVLTKGEPNIPHDVLDALSSKSPEEALSTTTGLGVVLRPHEFQRMMLKSLGQHSLADQLEEEGLVFPKTEEKLPVHLDSSLFSDVLAKLLLPLLSARSAFGPFIERRCVMIVAGPKNGSEKKASSLSTPLLRKIGAAYNGYRQQMMNFTPEAQSVLSRSNLGEDSLAKLAHYPVDELFTYLSAAYLRDAFIDEVGEPTIKQAQAGVEKGFPSWNTRDLVNLTGGSPCPE